MRAMLNAGPERLAEMGKASRRIAVEHFDERIVIAVYIAAIERLAGAPGGGMKTLVTGAAGFIGFHLCRRLARQGDEVTGIDSINDYYDPSLKYARLAELGFDRVTSDSGSIAASTIHEKLFFAASLCRREAKWSSFFARADSTGSATWQHRQASDTASRIQQHTSNRMSSAFSTSSRAAAHPCQASRFRLKLFGIRPFAADAVQHTSGRRSPN